MKFKLITTFKKFIFERQNIIGDTVINEVNKNGGIAKTIGTFAAEVEEGYNQNK